MSRKDKLRKLESRRQRGKINHRRQPDEMLTTDRLKKIILLSYDVSFEPLGRMSPEWAELSTIDEAELETAGQLVHTDPQQAQEAMRRLLDQHPGAAILTQWLIIALQKMGQDTHADELIEKNYISRSLISSVQLTAASNSFSCR